jgi:hypothetical protein
MPFGGLGSAPYRARRFHAPRPWTAPVTGPPRATTSSLLAPCASLGLVLVASCCVGKAVWSLSKGHVELARINVVWGHRAPGVSDPCSTVACCPLGVECRVPLLICITLRPLAHTPTSQVDGMVVVARGVCRCCPGASSGPAGSAGPHSCPWLPRMNASGLGCIVGSPSWSRSDLCGPLTPAPPPLARSPPARYPPPSSSSHDDHQEHRPRHLRRLRHVCGVHR